MLVDWTWGMSAGVRTRISILFVCREAGQKPMFQYSKARDSRYWVAVWRQQIFICSMTNSRMIET